MAVGDRMTGMAAMRRNANAMSDARAACRVASSVQQTLRTLRATLDMVKNCVNQAPGGRDGILTVLQAETDGDNLCKDVGDILDDMTTLVNLFPKLDDDTAVNNITRAQVDTFLAP